jgi:hypothetical protein
MKLYSIYPDQSSLFSNSKLPDITELSRLLARATMPYLHAAVRQHEGAT